MCSGAQVVRTSFCSDFFLNDSGLPLPTCTRQHQCPSPCVQHQSTWVIPHIEELLGIPRLISCHVEVPPWDPSRSWVRPWPLRWGVFLSFLVARRPAFGIFKIPFKFPLTFPPCTPPLESYWDAGYSGYSAVYLKSKDTKENNA